MTTTYPLQARLHSSFGSTPIAIHSTPTDPSSSYNSTRDTIDVMRSLVGKYCKSNLITGLVNRITSSLSDISTDREIVRTLFYWIKRNLKFEEDELILSNRLGIDPTEKELLITPDAMLSMNIPSGDCDDFTLFLTCLLCNLHFKCKFVTIACDRTEPFRFSHIYLKCFLEDERKWITLDSSHGTNPGWEYNQGKLDNVKIFQKVEWDIC